MSKSVEKTLSIIILLIGIAIYSITAFSYMYDKFVSKDVMELITKQLDRIELKIDLQREKINVIERERARANH